jgi:hypothetical protein
MTTLNQPDLNLIMKDTGFTLNTPVQNKFTLNISYSLNDFSPLGLFVIYDISSYS